MSADAYDIIARFWDIQDHGDYAQTAELFAEDAVLVDPVFGTFEGRAAIADFMSRMNEVVAATNGAFRLVELAGDQHTAWAQWHFSSDAGEREGVGVYRVDQGRIVYYRDYMNEPG